MTDTTHGAKPGADLPQKESAGSFDTTTADTNDATENIAHLSGIWRVIVRVASWLAVVFRGIA